MHIYHPPTDPWLTISYQDDDILIANKPSGLLSVPGRLETHKDSLYTRLQEHFPEIQPIHRLDMDTSGLMLFAKHKDAERALKKQFQYRLTHKVYFARVWGKPEQICGQVELPLICDWPNRPRQKICFDEGKPALTHYQVLESDGQTSVVALFPITGRSHQLRVHMQSLGTPILGDEFYARPEAYQASSRLELHASELSFYHPQSHQLVCHCVPCDFFHTSQRFLQSFFKPMPDLPDYKTLPSA